MFKELDVENRPRRNAYEYFKGFEDPFFSITGNVDVSHLYNFANKTASHSPWRAFFTRFRLRLNDGKVFEYERVEATQTILNDDETFSFCYFESKPTVHEFDEAGKLAREKYKRLKTFDVESDRLDLIYYSVIPWVSFTSFKHAGRFDNRQTVPRIVFGKIFDYGGGKKMPVSVEVNHAMMDGLHVGKFFNQFQAKIDDL